MWWGVGRNQGRLKKFAKKLLKFANFWLKLPKFSQNLLLSEWLRGVQFLVRSLKIKNCTLRSNSS
jgi:hypothetical protein